MDASPVRSYLWTSGGHLGGGRGRGAARGGCPRGGLLCPGGLPPASSGSSDPPGPEAHGPEDEKQLPLQTKAGARFAAGVNRAASMVHNLSVVSQLL